MKIQYTIGTHSYTEEMKDINLSFLNRQLKLSTPLITQVKLIYRNEIQTIFVGKEITLEELSKRNYFMHKYDLSFDEMVSISLKGYKRACLLNYKKYDSIIVGVKKGDKIVPDYYALKREVIKLVNNSI